MFQPYLFIYIFLLIYCPVFCKPDSTDESSINKPRIEAFLATSFMLNKNWNETNNFSVLLSGNLKITSSESKSDKRITELSTELAYLKFIDSTWVKNSDRLFASNIWILNKKKIKQTLSVSFTTQMTDTWIDKSKGVLTERKWKSGPLLPASIIVSYGFMYKIFPFSYINVSFPAYKVSSIPANKKQSDLLRIIKRNEIYILYHEYGLNVVINIERNIGQRLAFETGSTVFITQSASRHYFIDVRNQISYSPINNFKLRLENKILFDEKTSEFFQWKYDLLFGLNVNF